MNATLLRQRYVRDSVSTASPARLVTLLYERLVRDLTIAETAIGAGDLAEANRNLVHAQDIVIELRSSLRPEAWEGGTSLAALYGFLIRELIAANLAKDAGRVASCRRLVEPLRDAWQQATAGDASGAA
jgi:flagellar protein FliS